MIKSFSNILNIVLIAIIVLIMSGIVDGLSYSDAGSVEDPVVSLSYVEERLSSIYASLDARIKKVENNNTSTNSSYEVLEVKAGEFISLNANAQFILRSGEATAVAGVGGGLADLTEGVDLKTGDLLLRNHLLLIPKSDGRGVQMNTNGWIMINGGYTIK